MKTIHQLLETSAARYPEKTALIHDKQRVSYAELNKQANILARQLQGLGIRPGDRIALLWENSAEWVISYYGCLKVGAVISPMNTDMKPGTLRQLLADLAPRLLLASKRFTRLLKAANVLEYLEYIVLQSANDSVMVDRQGVIAWEAVMDGHGHDNLKLNIDDDACANIIYTSGSVSTPKGVILSHSNICHNVAAICHCQALTDADRHMAVLPFYYVMGLSVLNTHIAVGASVVLNNRFAYPGEVVDQMINEQVTGFSGVPSTYAFLLHRSPLKQKKAALGALRFCAQAGGHMPDKIKHELQTTLPGHVSIYIMYGATEASARLSCLNPNDFTTKMGSIGKAIPGVELCVLDEFGTQLPASQVGELVANGPNIMQGYLNDYKSTAAVLTKYGYHTGDLAYKDDEGFFYIIGRKDAILKVGGHRINPQEIENEVLNTDLAVEVAVFGVPDNLLGQRLVALTVVKNEAVDVNDLFSACHRVLPKHKLPSEFKIIQALPKKSNGKVDPSRFSEVYESTHVMR